MDRATTPTIIVVFGATGDLAKRKLLPALFSLFCQKMLPPKFKIIGFAKSEFSDNKFRKFFSRALKIKNSPFFSHAIYSSGMFEDGKAYKKLGEILYNLDKKFGVCSNKLFYLAVAPKYYKTILNNLAFSGLTITCSDGEGWTRVLVEKPFGEDADTARELDGLLSKLFREEQIFRIDHYLARETMQNILTFRFSNKIFEPLWNNQYVDKIEIKLLEKAGVGERGVFYDDIGALRDVGQNHLLQALAIIAMGHPGKLETHAIRQERAKILEALRPLLPQDIEKNTVRGQYRGYRKLKGVNHNSKTETYFKIKAFIDNTRWSGTPFYLEGGKGLKENLVAVSVYFKEARPCFCPAPHKDHKHQNLITFMVKPREGIQIRFWAKKPGLANNVEPKTLSVSHGSGDTPQTEAEAYDKVLFDCIQGEQMLFASTDEVMAAWRFITPILKEWESGKIPLKIY